MPAPLNSRLLDKWLPVRPANVRRLETVDLPKLRVRKDYVWRGCAMAVVGLLG
jgi:hypothetical protein